MIIDAQYANHISYASERDELAGDWLDDDLAGDAAEICRMIELSGMIGLECGLFEGE